MKVPNIRFSLKFFNEKGEEVVIRTLEDLRLNFNATDFYAYLSDGTLSRWLRCLGHPELVSRIEQALRENAVRRQMLAALKVVG